MKGLLRRELPSSIILRPSVVVESERYAITQSSLVVPTSTLASQNLDPCGMTVQDGCRHKALLRRGESIKELKSDTSATCPPSKPLGRFRGRDEILTVDGSH